MDFNSKQRRKSIKVWLSDEERKDLLDLMFAVLRNQKAMIKLIDEKLDLEVWKEVNHNKIEKMEGE